MTNATAIAEHLGITVDAEHDPAALCEFEGVSLAENEPSDPDRVWDVLANIAETGFGR